MFRHTLVLVALAASLMACADKAEEGTSRIPPPPSQIVYDASNYDDVAEGPFKHYLRAADALAHDRFEEARASLKTMATSSEGELQALAQTAAAASDIAAIRVAFKPLSQAVQALPLPEGMALAYCPMAFDYAGGHWVQRDGPIMNPYFGASMLHCGVLEDEGAGA
ncbi:MAG: hypothetical protein VYC64_11290 [Candidatus Latescibacterota bacterium]|nr:hypothetical protein [Candidatus Latescibacterota bacterium]